uniref:Elongin-C n=1 Tax=Leersia perrieri TaxID=77586 RepID=A0A0D9XVS8_9ORYZ
MLGKGEAAGQAHLHKDDDGGEQPSGVVKLISAEGFEFVVDKKAAMVSNTLRNMLTSPGGFSETREGEVRFPEISTPILEKICQYFYWSLHYSSGKETSEFQIEPEITLELMMAANYLDT